MGRPLGSKNKTPQELIKEAELARAKAQVKKLEADIKKAKEKKSGKK